MGYMFVQVVVEVHVVELLISPCVPLAPRVLIATTRSTSSSSTADAPVAVEERLVSALVVG